MGKDGGGGPVDEGKQYYMVPKIKKPEKFHWEQIDSNFEGITFRAKVPGGWLVMMSGKSMVFIPDPKHEWALEV